MGGVTNDIANGTRRCGLLGCRSGGGHDRSGRGGFHILISFAPTLLGGRVGLGQILLIVTDHRRRNIGSTNGLNWS